MSTKPMCRIRQSFFFNANPVNMVNVSMSLVFCFTLMLSCECVYGQNSRSVRPLTARQIQWRANGQSAAKHSMPRYQQAPAQEAESFLIEDRQRTETVPVPEDKVDIDQDDEDMEESEDDFQDNVAPEVSNWGQWLNKPIQNVRIDIRDLNANVPRDRSSQLVQSGLSDWTQVQSPTKVFAWVAPNIRYQPLYYEDIALERYGQARRDVPQFAVSSIHFFKSAVFLPYAMLVDPPKSCDYPLGFCRPGRTAPRTLQKYWYGSPRNVK